MFVPHHYHEPNESWMTDLIRENPLAELVSNGNGPAGPFATHVPVIPDPHDPDRPPGEIVGATLWGHMNRSNPHWAALESETPVVIVFTGPHAYVSPTLYQRTPAAPTWNFTAVHARGLLRRVDAEAAGDETLETVMATVRAFEARFGAGWAMSESVEYFRRIVPAVGAFRVTVSHVDGMFKLSQEQDADVRARVRESFAERESSNHKAIAAMMGRLADAE
ncbi:FMN-binding negative transcriptional regulator [Kutzneria buriramensis]|uniref:Transcriptional regulator n=1 Tax=Kutzneria buriramensis TaxID=1045776 RepID=A0A3E0HKC3_9PSEU|nr:FMN-binding negative transcriptional regulator [Kutzneria buriramensis]REH46922.1 transcriptional regulator [Kutzneria buriramensis]